MSKIEEYQKAKHTASKIAGAVAKTLGRDSTQNDKHEFGCHFSKLGNSTWAPMLFEIVCSHGYYGSSSGYSDTSEELGRYLALAIKVNASKLLDCAVSLANADAEKARQTAEKEAAEVLQQTAPM
mgnify:CR=1 FL=1